MYSEINQLPKWLLFSRIGCFHLHPISNSFCFDEGGDVENFPFAIVTQFIQWKTSISVDESAILLWIIYIYITNSKKKIDYILNLNILPFFKKKKKYTKNFIIANVTDC